MYASGMQRSRFGGGLGDDSDGSDGDFGLEDDGSTDTSTPIVVAPPATIQLATTSMGTGPASTPPPLVNYTPVQPFPGTASPTGVALAQAFKNPDGSPTYDGAPYSATDLLNPYNLQHMFGGLLTTLTGGAKPTTPTGVVAPASTIAGVKTSTIAVLAVVGLGAYLLLGRKKA
jgi:hypothetical protein